MKRSLTIIGLMLAAVSWAGNYTLELSNPSDCWLEITIVYDQSEMVMVKVLGPGSQKQVSLDSLLAITPKVTASRQEYNQQGALVKFREKWEWPKAKAGLLISYFADQGLTLFKGLKIKIVTIKGGKKVIDHKNNLEEIIKDQPGKVSKLELNGPPKKKAAKAFKVLVNNQSSRPITVPVLGKRNLRYLIFPGKERAVRVLEGQPLMVRGELRVEDRIHSWKRVSVSSISLWTPIKTDRLAVIYDRDLEKALRRKGVIINNTPYWAKLIAGFEGKLEPGKHKEFEVLAGERVQVEVMYFKDSLCTTPAGHHSIFMIYAESKSLGSGIYFRHVLQIKTRPQGAGTGRLRL
ncbi:hypothetical protein KJ840_02050 [Patescibacteria group bacterium]|nr:hypothetical protein [Patescibacteria group bacterium]